MILRTDRRRGFTLIEMLVVLVILGLVAGLVLARGPARSAGLDLRSQAAQLAGVLRGARGQAIATNQQVRFALDAARHGFSVDGGVARSLPPQMQAVLVGDQAEIVFSPDGSASGGTITLAEGAGRIQVAVDWLTGRVAVADVK